MDGDGKPDIISGNRIFDGQTGVDKTPSSMASLAQGGYPAIGDFNKDGSPDIVVFVQSASNDQKVAVIDVKADKFLMPMTSIPGGWGGRPPSRTSMAMARRTLALRDHVPITCFRSIAQRLPSPPSAGTHVARCAGTP